MDISFKLKSGKTFQGSIFNPSIVYIYCIHIFLKFGQIKFTAKQGFGNSENPSSKLFYHMAYMTNGIRKELIFR